MARTVDTSVVRLLGDSDPTRCPHGYSCEAARTDCPRCADRPIVVTVAPRPVQQTRWHATDTTLGPAWKVTITTALVVPLLLMIVQLRHASDSPVLAFLIVPIGGLGIFTAQFLPHLWEPGGLRTPNSHELASVDQAASGGDEPACTPDTVPQPL